MSAQALATVMGPPLMLHSANTAASGAAATAGAAPAEVDHAQPIAVLKYLLQIWPQPQVSAASGNVIHSIIHNIPFIMDIMNMTAIPTHYSHVIISILLMFNGNLPIYISLNNSFYHYHFQPFSKFHPIL